MKTQLPIWLVVLIVAIVIGLLLLFASKKVNAGTEGSVQPPGPPPPMPGGATAGQPK